jgi:hypothetical protein
MYIFTYQTKNLINDKTYIGVHSTNNLNDGYMGSGINIARAIKKYGKENFIMIPLSFFDTIDEAYAEEKYLVNSEWISKTNNYNITEGGNGGWFYVNMTGKNNHNLGKTFSSEHKQKMRLAKLGKSQTKEHRKNLQNSLQKTNWGGEKTNKWKDAHREFMLNQPKIKCPYCEKIGTKGPMIQHHFDNCKNK